LGICPGDIQGDLVQLVGGLIRQLLPGIFLPGLIYLVVSRHAAVDPSLAAASCVPLLDAVVRLCGGKAPSLVGAAFLVIACVSIALAVTFHSPLFILVKGAVVSFTLGIVLALSAAIRRPLTRWIAVSMSTEHGAAREQLRRRWRHPKALSVFRSLSAGWGLLLMVLAVQQAVMVLMVSPGLVMSVEPAVQAFVTVGGILTSVLYVRRIQHDHPELGMLPTRR
jgi:hypothetical protein